VTRLEDELRETFAGRVANVPAVRDVAGSAIARGRAVRRRQRISTGAAFAVVIALVASGTWWLRAGNLDDGGRSDSVAAPASAAADLPAEFDLVVGGELRAAGQAPITLPGEGDVFDAVRMPEGWLVVRGAKLTHELWLVRPQGPAALLIPAMPANFVISPDGRRVAYQQGSRLIVTSIADGKARIEHDVQLPGTDSSQGRTGAELSGWAGRYLVIGNRLGLGYDGFDLWDPARGAYVPTWNRDVVGIYAATPDGRSVVGAVKDGGSTRTCAAVLDPAAGLRVGDKTCGQLYLSISRHGLSPDGQWILAQANRAFGIVDAMNGRLTVTGAPAEGTWWGDPVWTGRDTFAVAEEHRILYVKVTDPQHPRELPVPSTTERWLVVAQAGG
jgi:hypothetical protein